MYSSYGVRGLIMGKDVGIQLLSPTDREQWSTHVPRLQDRLVGIHLDIHHPVDLLRSPC